MLSNKSKIKIRKDEYIYFSYPNVVDKILRLLSYGSKGVKVSTFCSSQELSSILKKLNKIYSNRDNEIYHK